MRTRLLLSGFLSNFFEFYDFTLFGIFAIPLSKLFFPGDQFFSLLTGLLAFSIAFFARPFGAFFFGYIGDTKGRKNALMLSILLMGSATFLIGCIPAYETVGIIAPLILVVCRLLQGFSLGGESNGSFIFLLEHTKNYKGLIGALVLVSGTTGMIFANVQGMIFCRENMPEWSWRIPFWMGLIISLIGIYIRNSLDETLEFLNYHNTNKNNTSYEKLRELLKYYKSCLCVIGIGGVNSVFVYMLVVYFNVYIKQFTDLPLSSLLLYPHIGLLMCVFTVPIMGYLSDKITCKVIMQYACIVSFIGAFVIPYTLSKQFFVITAVYLALVIGIFNGPVPAFINGLFPPNVRYTGISVGFSLGVAFFGGLSPAICTFLTKYFGSVFILTPYLLIISVIGLISIITALNQKYH